MTVYVDELRKYPHALPFFREGACHMSADTQLELIEFALSIGLKPAWIQRPGTPYEHFDLTVSKRKLALAKGAVFRPVKDWIRLARIASENRS